MGKTILELFKEKPLGVSGLTAEQYYDIRNSKDILVSSQNPIVDATGFNLARIARKSVGIRTAETFIESETTGLRIIHGGASVYLYGNEITRLLTRTTNALNTMRQASSGGVLGRVVEKVSNAVNSKLGIPSLIIPTVVANAEALNTKGETQNRMIDLAEIRNSGDGGIVGKFLKQTGGGSIDLIGRKIAGNLISEFKETVRGKLFGERSVTRFNTATAIDTYGGELYITGNYGSIDDGLGVTLVTSNGIRNAKGLMYSKTFNFAGQSENDTFVSNTDFMEGGLVVKTPRIVLSRFDTPTLNSLATNVPYSFLFQVSRRTANDTIDKNGNIKPLDKNTFGTVQNIKANGENDSILLGKNGYDAYSDKIEFRIDRTKITQDPDRVPKFKDSKYGMGTKSDVINNQGVYNGETIKVDNKLLDEYDYVPLKLYSLAQDKTVQFRSTLSSVSETVSPSWSSNKFAGSPFSYHTYTSVDRTISLSFKVFPLSVSDHINNWDKLNFLTSLAYPQGYYDNSAVIPPFIKFTLGVMYKNRLSFINSVSYAFEDAAGWHVDVEDVDINNNTYNTKDYRLPRVIEVSLGITLLESRANTQGKFYSFTPKYL